MYYMCKLFIFRSQLDLNTYFIDHMIHSNYVDGYQVDAYKTQMIEYTKWLQGNTHIP